MTDEEWLRELDRRIEEYTGVKPGPPNEERVKMIQAFLEEREKQKKQSGGK